MSNMYIVKPNLDEVVANGAFTVMDGEVSVEALKQNAQGYEVQQEAQTPSGTYYKAKNLQTGEIEVVRADYLMLAPEIPTPEVQQAPQEQQIPTPQAEPVAEQPAPEIPQPEAPVAEPVAEQPQAEPVSEEVAQEVPVQEVAEAVAKAVAEAEQGVEGIDNSSISTEIKIGTLEALISRLEYFDKNLEKVKLSEVKEIYQVILEEECKCEVPEIADGGAFAKLKAIAQELKVKKEIMDKIKNTVNDEEVVCNKLNFKRLAEYLGVVQGEQPAQGEVVQAEVQEQPEEVAQEEVQA